MPFNSNAATCTTVSDCQKKATNLQQQVKDDQAAKTQKQKEQDQLNGQIADLNDQIQGITQKINDTTQQISDTQKGIADKKDQIATQEDELAKQRDEQDEALRVMYETGNPSTLEMLVGSQSLSDFFTYQDYLDALEGHVEQTIDVVSNLKNQLESEKADLEAKQTSLTNLQAQQQQYNTALDTQKAQKNNLLANAKNAEQSLTQKIADAQKTYTDVNSELSKLQEEARQHAAQQAAGKLPAGTASSLGFQWPVTFRAITTYFGGQTPFQNFHTGLDLANLMGTPIVAAADGTVSHIGVLNYGYGHYVVIGHNARYSTLYGHMMDFAPGLHEGQAVHRGDVIGYIGMTGWTTGPHLHFEVRDYGVPVDPLPFMPAR